MNRLGRVVGRWETLLVLLLIASFVFGAARSPYFFNGSNLSFMTANFMEKAIMALPMTLIIIAGEIDLSVASILGLASSVLGVLWDAGVPLWAGIAIVLLVGAVAGLGNGLLVTGLGLPSLVVTLGTLALYRGLASVVLGDRSVSNYPAGFTNFGFGTVPGTRIPWPFVIFAVLTIIFAVILHGSRLGREIYAIGSNKEAARFSAVQVARIKVALFVLSGVLSAVAGVIYTARFASSRADNATGFELDVITAVLLGGISIFGGRGTLVGVVLALFIIGTLRNALALTDVTDEVQSIVVGTLLIISVLGPNLAARARAVLVRRRAGPPALARGPGD